MGRTDPDRQEPLRMVEVAGAAARRRHRRPRHSPGGGDRDVDLGHRRGGGAVAGAVEGGFDSPGGQRMIAVTLISARVSVCFQDSGRFELVLRESVARGDLDRAADDVAVMAAMERAGARELVHSLAGGLQSQLGRSTGGGAELSAAAAVTLLVSHRRNSIPQADVVVHLEGGQVVDARACNGKRG